MTWWLWILFWIVFWSLALGYLAWRCWRLWPHLRRFGLSVQTAWERAESTMDSARAVGSAPERRGGGAVVATLDVEELAWNRSAASWRRQWRAERRRRRELRLDQHASTWASWRRRVD